MDRPRQLSEGAGLDGVLAVFETSDRALGDTGLMRKDLGRNCLAPARISSRYFGSTTLSYSQKILSAASRTPDSDIIDKSGPLAQRVDGSLPM